MFKMIVEPRFGDVDGLGHINNTVIPQWFELARNPIFRIFHPDLNLDLKKWKLIMAKIEVDFRKPLIYQQKVEIRTYLERVGTSSFTLRHEAWQNGELASKGLAVGVYYDFINKRSMPIPQNIIDQLTEHMKDSKNK